MMCGPDFLYIYYVIDYTASQPFPDTLLLLSLSTSSMNIIKAVMHSTIIIIYRYGIAQLKYKVTDNTR